MSTNLHVMGNRIRTARQFRKLTAEQLSEQLGIATESLRHIENGTRRPSYALLDNISDILDVSLDYLAGKTELPLERRVRREYGPDKSPRGRLCGDRTQCDTCHKTNLLSHAPAGFR